MTTKAVTHKEAVHRGTAVLSRRERRAAVTSNRGIASPRRVPMFIAADEAYYWTREWQKDVQESMRALRAGEFKDFNSEDPNDVARWLLTVDEDDCD